MLQTNCKNCNKTWAVPGNDKKAELKLRRRVKDNPCNCSKVDEKRFWELWNKTLFMLNNQKNVN